MRGMMDKYQRQVEFLILDYDDRALTEYRSKFQIGAPPAFAVIDGDGEIVVNFVGQVSSAAFERAIVDAIR